MVFTYKIQKWSDIETSTTKVTMLNIGVAGNEIRNRCQPFLSAFKYYRVVGMKVSLLPASTLPADPSQISYESGENSVNPADMMNVGLVRYTNGEAFSNYKQLTAPVSAGAPFEGDSGMQTYFNMMLDRRWSKFGLQRGMSRFFRPMIYEDGLPMQSVCPDEAISWIHAESSGQFNVANSRLILDTPNAGDSYLLAPEPNSSQYPNLDNVSLFGTSDGFRFQTGRLKRLGWRTTDIAHLGGDMLASSGSSKDDIVSGFNTFPFINMGRIILPRALKTKFAFRVVQTIIVQFRGAVNISPQNTAGDRYLADMGIYPTGSVNTVPQNVTGGNFWGGNQV